MTPEEMEKEIQARVEFKMNELLTGLKNVAQTNWGVAFTSMSQKHTHYWEAFDQMVGMFNKELNMPVPIDEMHRANQRSKRDAAITKVMERFCKLGERDYHQKERFLVGVMLDVQNI
jgi:hypothetical protein